VCFFTVRGPRSRSAIQRLNRPDRVPTPGPPSRSWRPPWSLKR
jgi:hypothetical protein